MKMCHLRPRPRGTDTFLQGPRQGRWQGEEGERAEGRQAAGCLLACQDFLRGAPRAVIIHACVEVQAQSSQAPSVQLSTPICACMPGGNMHMCACARTRARASPHVRYCENRMTRKITMNPRWGQGMMPGNPAPISAMLSTAMFTATVTGLIARRTCGRRPAWQGRRGSGLRGRGGCSRRWAQWAHGAGASEPRSRVAGRRG